ncbi:uncharacterized protein RCC_08385 [Ramularia collo-cygni]|uniref:LIM zinc-binding domain-containing protein n=1 Tax=Ramularia collo-cygni TaxID=112498 RepID=A0A2D3V726_9PEZI|nr:uncharacterized protein RCC_08385 [Ramularia collo-cygni]CZT22680.1 uncharacterized protein RCC_08385 [Ramularia collo-cygni]
MESSPSPTRTASYLKDLRRDRPQRPAGSRPAPVSSRSVKRASASAVATPPTTITRDDVTTRVPPRSPFAGRPLARAPTPTIREEGPDDEEPKEETEEEVSEKSTQRRSAYMENGMRWMEKQEAKSLRMALEDMDLEEERKVHSAARDEAAELVWKHRYPEQAAKASFANPDLDKYSKHLRRGSYQRSHSSAEEDRSASSSSTDEEGSRRASYNPQRSSTPVESVKRRMSSDRTSKSYGPLADAVAKDIAVAHRRSSSGSVRVLSGEKKMFMSPQDKIWEDPCEEAEISPPSPVREPVRVQQAPRVELPAIPSLPPTMSSSVRKNPFARVRAQFDSSKLERANSAPTLQSLPHAPIPVLRHDRVEIQRNPPTQSRNPWYVSNQSLPPTPPPQPPGREEDETAPKNATPTRRSVDDDVVEEVRMKDGKEVRGDDIRAATGKRRTDYSPNLPRPTLVSDKPGRPIVSFEKKKEIVLEEGRSAVRELPSTPRQASPIHSIPSINLPNDHHPPVPTINLPDEQSSIPTINFPDDASAVPTINFPDDHPTIPTINLPGDSPSIPTINLPGDDDAPTSPSTSPTHSNNSIPQRPLPSPARPVPHHAATAIGLPSHRSTPHYTPSLRSIPTGALCTHCALPIAGRILSAAGNRFHPGCFVCHTCGTNLECVAFYPEPDQANRDREAEQGDVRFFCHLDYHEHFSPRCKSCKTPIESGEVISACGATYHPGHFFCAECGDPFDSKMPFVEREGFAWCVGCFEKRTAVKCRGCKKGIMEVVVKAAGADWHEACFRCEECGGGFHDGRYFLREERGGGEVVCCVGCEERRLKG